MSIKTKFFRAAAVLISVAAVTASAADWPGWHGADRTNKSKETGLLKQWPKEGPKLIWTASGLGDGYSSVSTSGGVVFSAGVKEKVNYVSAFDRAGKLLWETAAGPSWDGARASWARQYSGARSTPSVDGGIVYYLSDTGLLVALDAKTGETKWNLNIREKYAAEVPLYGYSESPLIVGDKLYVTAYGSKAGALCLNKNTGDVIWASTPVNGEAGYASLIMAENSGYKQLISTTAISVFAIDAETGKHLWTVPLKNSRDNNCTDAIYHDGHVLVSTGYGRGTILIKLEKKDKDVTAKKVYDIKLMDNHHGGVILHNGHVYGSGHESRGWFCLDFKTGRQVWRHSTGKGSITFADGMLYLYDENGTMALVKADPAAFAEVSSFKVPEGGKGPHWARPVVSNGILYVRHADKLYAYDIKAK
ncbi:MAG: PQQ-binding-like beta-propeller repeat protein [Chitinispirillia bacterium]|nr:PQQ-binding-like beta-propeller repeat protein [Chitinispirillia bacterium]MCL2269113.1 PQQ-binding-like beta-propeller repeat protein [Chitinispirillia bacterium]